MKIILALLLGTAFGFALDRAKASDPQKIINMLRLKDFHLMKVILFAIGFSSLILFVLLSVNAINPNHLSVKPSYIGVVVGGALLGGGFAIGGYCPGTCLVAAGRGRKDALMFLLGGLLGAFFYMLVFSALKDTALFTEIGGALAWVNTNPEKYSAVFPNIPALMVAGPIAIVFMAIAFLLPSTTSAAE